MLRPKTLGLKERVESFVEEMSIEQGLVSLREERGLSQRALADLVGVTQPVIARIESGKARNLELKTVVRIAAALGARVKILTTARLPPPGSDRRLGVRSREKVPPYPRCCGCIPTDTLYLG